MRNEMELSTSANIRFVDKKRERGIEDIKKQYELTLANFSDKNRLKKIASINSAFQTVSKRLTEQKSFVFEERQKAILQLKLARYFQKIKNTETIDHNTLSDAIIESPRFLNEDRGSLHHLLEVHEQKTLLKIAEIRKKQAEMTGNEGINPYEVLFTTKSGKYYLARLLNMTHLEKESEYMKHCVGTSTSYFNRMKNGEIEIFSFRKLEGDFPLLTIEYNLKTGTVAQIKKKSDQYLERTDPFFEDVLDGLSRLRSTKNDLGKPREINKINTHDLKNINVKPEHFLTDHGEVHFLNMPTKDAPFIFKAGRMELTRKIKHKDAAKLLQIFEHRELNPQEIANSPKEINKNTKAYVGKLEPGVFNLVQQYDIKYIYTSFPEGRVRIEKDFETLPITLEEFEGKKDHYNKNIKDESWKIEISDHTKEMMHSEDFTTLKKPEKITLVRLKVSDLGFKRDTAIELIYRRAQALSLELCPPEVAPNMRLRYKQPFGDRIRIGMEEIVDRGGRPRIFDLGHNERAMWFGGEKSPHGGWHPDDEFVFCLPQKPQS